MKVFEAHDAVCARVDADRKSMPSERPGGRGAVKVTAIESEKKDMVLGVGRRQKGIVG